MLRLLDPRVPLLSLQSLYQPVVSPRQVPTGMMSNPLLSTYSIASLDQVWAVPGSASCCRLMYVLEWAVVLWSAAL